MPQNIKSCNSLPCFKRNLHKSCTDHLLSPCCVPCVVSLTTTDCTDHFLSPCCVPCVVSLTFTVLTTSCLLAVYPVWSAWPLLYWPLLVYLLCFRAGEPVHYYTDLFSKLNGWVRIFCLILLFNVLVICAAFSIRVGGVSDWTLATVTCGLCQRNTARLRRRKIIFFLLALFWHSLQMHRAFPMKFCM